MKFIITNRYAVEVYTNRIEPYAVISITSPYNEFPLIQNGYSGLLQLKFLDIDVDEEKYYLQWPEFKGISKKDASKIVDFTESYKYAVDLFVINCNAGISRSAGTAAALSKIYNGDDMWVFKDRRYCPNMRVYRYILEEAFERKLIRLPERGE